MTARWRLRLTPYLVLGVMVVVTAAASLVIGRVLRERDRAGFLVAVQGTVGHIEARLQTYVAVLVSTRALFATGIPVDAAHFRAYGHALDLRETYPGIQGIGYSARLTREEHARGPSPELLGARPPFRFWPTTPRDEHHAIVFLEPLDARNRAALGYDMFSEPVRRAAMERARDTGLPAATDRVTLVQEIDPRKQPGFLIYVPFYGTGPEPTTVAERRARLQGFIYAPFRAEDLLRATVGSREDRAVAFQVANLASTGRPEIFYKSTSADPPGHEPTFTAAFTFPVAGRTWEVTFRTRTAFDAFSEQRYVAYVAAAGLFVSLLLFLASHAQMRARLSAERNEERIRFLAEASARMAGALEAERLVADLAQFAVPVLGEWCFADLVTDQGRTVRVAASHVDPRYHDVSAGLMSYPPDVASGSPVAAAIATAKVQLAEITPEGLRRTAQDERHLELMRMGEGSSLLAVPLVTRGRVHAVLSFMRRRPYQASDCALAEDLASRAALALDNARLFAEARQAAADTDTLNRVGRALAAELDPDALSRQLVEETTRVIGADVGALLRRGDPGRTLVLGDGAPAELCVAAPASADDPLIAQVLSSGAPACVVSGEAPQGTPGGALKSWVTVSIVGREGDVIGALFFGRRRRQAFSAREEQLLLGVAAQSAVALDNARLYRQAQDAVQARDAFLSIASHELKTPLTALQLQTDALARTVARGHDGLKDLDRLGRKVRAIDGQSRRLARLIDELLDVSRITAGRLTFDLQQVDLAELAREVASRFEEESSRAGVPISVDAGRPVVGTWDRSRLDQAVTNLVSNAIKYGQRRPVDVVVDQEDGAARLLVRDRGIGIAPEHQSRIFDRFERFVSERHYGGFGLGLWITRQIVEAQGGRIRVDSAVGQGSTFVVELPLGARQ